MKITLFLAFVFLLASSIQIHAQCPKSIDDFNVNQLNTSISPVDLWWDGTNPKFEYPGGSGLSPVFAGGFWMSGIINEDIRSSTQAYERANDSYEFIEGPVGASGDSYFCSTFQVSSLQVDLHLVDLQDGTLDNPIPEIMSWPGRGNPNGPSILETDDFAPFMDVNANGIYEPSAGDYPAFVGDRAAWWVSNTTVNGSNSNNAWNAELHVLAQAYGSGSEQLQKTQFYKATFINREDSPIDSAALTLFMDTDIGCGLDDAIGSIPELNLLYSYNVDSIDGLRLQSCGGVPVYFDSPPVIVTQILSADHLGSPVAPRFSGIFSVTVGSQSIYSTVQRGPTAGNPVQAYHLTHGRWRNGESLTFGGRGIGGSQPTNWPFNGEPSDTTWNVCGPFIEDYKILLNTSISDALMPNGRLSVDYGVYTVDEVVLPCPSTDLIRDAANEILSIYQQQVSSTQPAFAKTIASFEVFPNPSSGILNCVLPNGATIESLQAFDLTGRNVSLTWEHKVGAVKAQLNGTGIFFLLATDEKGELYRSRIVVD